MRWKPSVPASALRRHCPDYFVSAQTLAPEDHLAVQAAAQKYIDSSISKTINVPATISFEAFKDIYARSLRNSVCKGCTTYRPNAVTDRCWPR